MADIRVSPETLNAQGTDLVNYAGEVSELLNKIYAKIQEMIEGWDGAASEGYNELHTTMKQSLDKFPELVSSLGEAAISAAGVYDETDTTLGSTFRSAGS